MGTRTDECCRGLMSVSQCCIQLVSALQTRQTRADRTDASTTRSRTQCSPHSWITHTDLLTLTAASREGLGGDRGSERKDRAGPLLHSVGAEIRAGQHTAQYTKANGVLFLSEHLILLTVTEVIEEEGTL